MKNFIKFQTELINIICKELKIINENEFIIKNILLFSLLRQHQRTIINHNVSRLAKLLIVKGVV